MIKFGLRLLFCLSLSILSGCGFHLQQSESHLSEYVTQIHFVPMPTDGLQQKVLQSLQLAHINVLAQKQNAYTLKMSAEIWESRVLAYGPDSRPIRERLTLITPFELLSAKNEILIKDKLIIARERQLSPLKMLADSEEKQVLQVEMRADAAQMLLYKLSAYKWQ